MSDLQSLLRDRDGSQISRLLIYSLLGAAVAFTALAALLATGTLGAPPWLLTLGVGANGMMLGLLILALALAVTAGLMSYRRYRRGQP